MRYLVGATFFLFVGCNPSSSTTGDGGVDGGPETDCVEPTGAGTMHGSSIMADETWTAEGSPHILANDTSIYAKLTLAPCAVVLIGDRKTITVGTPGASIVAQGTERKPVAIAQKDEGKPWVAIRALNGGKLSFTWTGILGGGDKGNTLIDLAAAIDVRADAGMPLSEAIHVDHVLVQDSASQGIRISQGAVFSSTSNGLVITKSANYPLFAAARLAGSIPTGNYTGNAKDEILINGTNAADYVNADTTFHDRGVPYHIGDTGSDGRLDVHTTAGTVATLTLEPGVKLRFKKGGAFWVEPSSLQKPGTAALIAVGTQDKPIVMTSAEASPAPGDWLGLGFYNIDPSSKVDFAEVEYAGGGPGSGNYSCPYAMAPVNLAAIRILAEPPGSAFITNTTIKDSANHGFDRGYKDPGASVSFLGGGNTFMGMITCKETFPNPNTTCPNPPPCP